MERSCRQALVLLPLPEIESGVVSVLAAAVVVVVVVVVVVAGGIPLWPPLLRAPPTGR